MLTTASYSVILKTDNYGNTIIGIIIIGVSFGQQLCEKSLAGQSGHIYSRMLLSKWVIG